jgi:hypothetical protein
MELLKMQGKRKEETIVLDEQRGISGAGAEFQKFVTRARRQ